MPLDLVKTGIRFRTARVGASLTQKRAAEAIGSTQKSLSAYETGKNCPNLGIAKACADLYGVRLDDLLVEDEA